MDNFKDKNDYAYYDRFAQSYASDMQAGKNEANAYFRAIASAGRMP